MAAAQRAYFFAVGCFALWVGLWGYFFPADVARAIPWPVPPLHSRFIGAMYLSGAMLMFGALLRVGRANMLVPLVMAAVWTGMLLAASLFHLAEFDPANPRVWFWFGAYIVFPIAGAWLAWQLPKPAAQSGNGLLRNLLFLQAMCCGALAFLLFVFPSTMATYWPWAIPELLAQIYAGPFLSLAVGSFLLSRRSGLADMRLPLLAMLGFALLVLVASVLHRGVLGEVGLSDVAWYGGFLLAVLLHLYGLLSTRPARVLP